MATPEYQTEDAGSQTGHDATYYDDPPEEEIADIEGGIDEQRPRTGAPKVETHFQNRGQTPAYVSPIGNLGSIPPIPQSNGISSTGRPTIPHFLTSRLVGKAIDEYGDVLDEDGQILGQVAGDLPAMVGRLVTSENGDVLDDDGGLLGYIVHVTTEKEKRENNSKQQHPNTTQTLDAFTNGDSSTFRVDNDGNILDSAGNVVGKFHDNSSNPQSKTADDSWKQGTKDAEDAGGPPKENAESFRKEGESPSDIFLDVKSTTEGIQLTIRIPTVFPGSGRAPKVQFS